MSSADLVATAAAQAEYEWRQTSSGTYEREVVGGERMFDFLERNNHGHSEGAIIVHFDTRGDDGRERMLNRIKNGYLQTYVRHPLIGCTIETELRDQAGSNDETNKVSYLRYRKPETTEQASQLVHSYVNVIRLTDPSELPDFVFNRRVGEGDNRRATLYVLLGPHKVSLAFYLSHVVYDIFYGVRAYNDMLSFIAHARADSVDYSLATAPIAYAEMQRRLPISLSFAYEQQIKPTQEDKQAGVEHWENVLLNGATKDSVLVPSDGDAAFRKHKRGSAKATISAYDTQRLTAFCKSTGLPLVCLLSASYLQILAQEYMPKNGEEAPEGIKLSLPLPVQQWLDVNPNDKHGPVSCALMAGLVWVPIRDASLLDIAISLGQAMQAQLTHPHPIGKEAQEALLMPYVNNFTPTSSEYLPPGFPGVSFVGNVTRAFANHYAHQGLEMTMSDIYMGTRCMSNRPWVLGSVWQGRLIADLYFDQKYLDQNRMQRLIHQTMDNLLSVLPEEELPQRQSRL